MYNRNDEKLGVGLFAEIIGPFQKLTANLEQKILSYLEI
ncbi:MAG: hypothetical protein QG556_1151, partial [Pseudomonadota bacterium]|nr:hypothetical protein [Pseudomonadota bacterium]